MVDEIPGRRNQYFTITSTNLPSLLLSITFSATWWKNEEKNEDF
jgi:hypothetical protein